MSASQDYETDDLDLAILDRFQKDGRRPFAEVARDLGVSANTVRNRIGKMMEHEVMSFVTLISPQKVGYRAYVAIYIFVDPPHLEEAARKIAAFPEVIWLAETTGDYNLTSDVVCRDIDELQRFINRRLHQITGVKKTSVVFYLKYHKLSSFSLLLRAAGNDSPTSPLP